MSDAGRREAQARNKVGTTVVEREEKRTERKEEKTKQERTGR